MRKIAISAAAVLAASLAARASWYWPFGDDDSSTNKPPRLHILLEKANDLIEQGEDAALEGDSDKALEHYRAALDELSRVERENPDRAATPEFAPLRNKAAACQAAIDSIRFEQVNRNTRAVSLTDTSGLERKWRKKHGLETEEDRAAEAAKTNSAPEKADSPEKAADGAKPEKEAQPEDAEKSAEQTKPAEQPRQAEPAEQAGQAEPAEQAKPAEREKPAEQPKSAEQAAAADNPLQSAITSIKSKDYAAADLILEDLMRERPNDLNILLLRAAAQAGGGSYNAARRTLERAMRAHPKSPLPYYNLAHLYLNLGNDLENARQYYDLNLEFDGPRSPVLEAKFKAMKSKPGAAPKK